LKLNLGIPRSEDFSAYITLSKNKMIKAKKLRDAGAFYSESVEKSSVNHHVMIFDHNITS
jgi:hypothetical protein